MDCSPPASSVCGISQARILEQVAISISQGIFPTQGLNWVSCIVRQTLYPLSHREAHLIFRCLLNASCLRLVGSAPVQCCQRREEYGTQTSSRREERLTSLPLLQTLPVHVFLNVKHGDPDTALLQPHERALGRSGFCGQQSRKRESGVLLTSLSR